MLANKLEITPPSQYAYAMIAAEADPLQFKVIKAKVKNTTNDAMQNGTLVAVAKYKKTTEDPAYLYSISKPKTGVSLAAEAQTEYAFDFSGNPIPVNITDLRLELVFTGTIGTEANAMATGMKDISVPTSISIFNNTDKSCIKGNWYDR